MDDTYYFASPCAICLVSTGAIGCQFLSLTLTLTLTLSAPAPSGCRASVGSLRIGWLKAKLSLQSPKLSARSKVGVDPSQTRFTPSLGESRPTTGLDLTQEKSDNPFAASC